MAWACSSLKNGSCDSRPCPKGIWWRANSTEIIGAGRRKVDDSEASYSSGQQTCLSPSNQSRKTVNRGEKEGSLMIDTKVLLALALLLGSIASIPDKPPAGGLPIPQVSSGVNSAN